MLEGNVRFDDAALRCAYFVDHVEQEGGYGDI